MPGLPLRCAFAPRGRAAAFALLFFSSGSARFPGRPPVLPRRDLMYDVAIIGWGGVGGAAKGVFDASFDS